VEIFSDAYNQDQGYLSGVYGPAPPLDAGSRSWTDTGYSGVSGWAPMHCSWIVQLPPALATLPLASSTRPAGSYCDPSLPGTNPNYGSQGGPGYADWFLPEDYTTGLRGIQAWDNWYVRRVVTLPAGAIIGSAQLTWAADDQAWPYVDGNLVPWAGPGGSWNMAAGPVNVASLIPSGGSFVLGFMVTNQNNGGSTGLVYRLDITYCLPTTPTASPSPSPSPSPSASSTATPSPSATRSPVTGLTAFVPSSTPTVTPTATPSPTAGPPAPPGTIIIATQTPSQSQLLILRGVYPVPSTGPVTLFYTLREAAQVTVGIYNVAGEKLWDTQLAAGAGVQTLVWPGCNVNGARAASGLYLLRLEAVTDAGERDSAWGTAALQR
jgi:hypothetical protein